MLGLAFAVLTVTVCLGLYLCTNRPRNLALVHGACGAAGLLLLLLIWRTRLPQGVLAKDCVFLLLAGFSLGLTIAWFGTKRRRVPFLILMLHATAGGLGTLLLAGLALGH